MGKMTLTQKLASGMIIGASPSVFITQYHMAFDVGKLTLQYNATLTILLVTGAAVWWANAKKDSGK